MTVKKLGECKFFGSRISSIGKSVNLVAIHSSQTNLSPEVMEYWYGQAVEWIKNLGVVPQSFSTYGVTGFEEARKYSFLSADKKIKSRGFGDIESLNLSASPISKSIFESNPNVKIGITNAQVIWGGESSVLGLVE